MSSRMQNWGYTLALETVFELRERLGKLPIWVNEIIGNEDDNMPCITVTRINTYGSELSQVKVLTYAERLKVEV